MPRTSLSSMGQMDFTTPSPTRKTATPVRSLLFQTCPSLR